MELIDVLHTISQQGMNAAALTDLSIGTVVSTSPLKISINSSMAPLQAPVLLATANVVERTLHNAGTNTYCTENGVHLPASGGTVTINESLNVGDKVLLLRVMRGQRFIILSRVFEVS